MPYHICIEGGLGAGKTFNMSLLAHWWKEQVEKQGGKIQLFSNYELKDSLPIDSYEDWYKVAAVQGSICCWDESHVNFSNRRWNSFQSGISTEVLMYMRKMQSVQIYATPSINFLDSRIRVLIEIKVNVKHVKAGFILNFYDNQTGEFLRKAFISQSKANKIYKMNLYDTNAFVRGFPLPGNERQANEFWNELARIHDESRGKIKI